MALYLGSSEKLKIALSGTTFRFHLPIEILITEAIKLMSFDNYILKDVNGLYLIPKEDE